MRLTVLFSLLILVAIGAMPAAAQATDTLQVAIPFAFTAHNISMPAGDYRITRAADGSGLLAIQNVETRDTVFLMTSQTGHGIPPLQSSVSFRTGGMDYVLADVSWAGYASAARLQPSHAPAMTASAKTAGTILLAAR